MGVLTSKDLEIALGEWVLDRVILAVHVLKGVINNAKRGFSAATLLNRYMAETIWDTKGEEAAGAKDMPSKHFTLGTKFQNWGICLFPHPFAHGILSLYKSKPNGNQVPTGFVHIFAVICMNGVCKNCRWK